MKALIFAAGLGKRLKPLTDIVPKALVPINEKPLIQYVIERLKEAGVDEIIINIHHFADQIIDFIRSNNDFNIRIEFSDERDLLLDTGGGIKKVSGFFDDGKPFFVHNTDILSNIDLQQFYCTHMETKALASLYVCERKTSRYLLFDKDNNLKAWINRSTGEIKPTGSITDPDNYLQLAFNGIHVLSPTIFDYMHNWEGKFSIIDFYLSIANQIVIKAFNPSDTIMMDVGKAESLHEAEFFIQKISNS